MPYFEHIDTTPRSHRSREEGELEVLVRRQSAASLTRRSALATREAGNGALGDTCSGLEEEAAPEPE